MAQGCQKQYQLLRGSALRLRKGTKRISKARAKRAENHLATALARFSFV